MQLRLRRRCFPKTPRTRCSIARKPVHIPEEELLKQLALLESEREPAQIPELQQPALL